MNPDRWRQISLIYHATLTRNAGDRAAFLREACAGDDVLRGEVASLLSNESQADGFLSKPVFAAAVGIVNRPAGSMLIGRRIGVYQIQTLLGAGGMGEVYRARDTTLNRDVALKVLPEDFVLDLDRLGRFKREAQVLASLNHPNIAAIYGLEESDGVQALVLELVEGPTLADRIAQGPMALEDALPIAKQIADAIEAAHEQGIIHRDLKPANIKVRSDGAVKVLDFGLAKALEPTGAMAVSASMSPTITTPMMTEAGMILGTAAYMSPEQAKGRPVDKRSDVWAFGAVLYEMFTGGRAFEGDDVADTLARILMQEPNWTALPATIPPAVVTVLRRCLQKDRKQRARDIGDVWLALEGAFETTAPQTAPMATPAGRRLAWMAALAVATVLAAALAIPTVRHLREAPLSSPETRLEIATPATDNPESFALSSDGRQIVFVASGEGASRLWLRSLATTTAQPLAGTEGARLPFWSPDGRSIGFFAGGALKRLDLDGGVPQTLAPAPNGNGGTWSADGVIVFVPAFTSPLMRVSATGGAATVLSTLGPQQAGRGSPYFLPDGRRFLFSAFGAPETTGIYLAALDGSAPTRLTPADSAGVFLPTGWLLWVRAGTLVAQRLDGAKAALMGEPVTLADGVAVEPTVSSFASAVSVAATGLVAYRMGAGGQRQLTWIDHSGTARGTVGDPDDAPLRPRVSPDGRRVVVDRTVQSNTDVWLLDGARMSRVTFDAAADLFPIWSPDGTRIVYRSARAGLTDIYQRLTSGAGVEERLVASDQSKVATSWSADGRFLLYHSNDPQTNTDLWVLPMVGERTPSVFLKTPFRELNGVFSSDGRWVAYMSNESGRMEIYVRPFVAPRAVGTAAEAAGGQWQVSTAGGIHPVWRRDGRELYYLNPAGAMMAAPITVTGATFEPGAPVVLFPTRIFGGGVDVQQGRQYDVAPDGRFLINSVVDETPAPITLLQNWNPEAKK